MYVVINTYKKPYWVFLERNEQNGDLFDLTVSFGSLSEPEDFVLEGMTFNSLFEMNRLIAEVIAGELNRRANNNAKT